MYKPAVRLDTQEKYHPKDVKIKGEVEMLSWEKVVKLLITGLSIWVGKCYTYNALRCEC